MPGLGNPLHFTELTALSGEHGWERPRPGLQPLQAKRARPNTWRSYTSCSSPTRGVEPLRGGILWTATAGAPSALVREDLTPKPVYSRLLALIKDRWHTSVAARADSQGEVRFRMDFWETIG